MIRIVIFLVAALFVAKFVVPSIADGVGEIKVLKDISKTTPQIVCYQMLVALGGNDQNVDCLPTSERPGVPWDSDAFGRALGKINPDIKFDIKQRTAISAAYKRYDYKDTARIVAATVFGTETAQKVDVKYFVSLNHEDRKKLWKQISDYMQSRSNLNLPSKARFRFGVKWENSNSSIANEYFTVESPDFDLLKVGDAFPTNMQIGAMVTAYDNQQPEFWRELAQDNGIKVVTYHNDSVTLGVAKINPER